MCIFFFCGHKFQLSLDNQYGVWLVDCIVREYFILWKTTKLSSKVAVPFLTPTSSAWEFTRWWSPHQHLVLSVPDSGHFNRDVVVCHCCFNLHFSDNIWCGASSHYAYLTSGYLLGWVLLRRLAHVLIKLLFPYCCILRVLCTFLDHSPFNRCAFSKFFSKSVPFS